MTLYVKRPIPVEAVKFDGSRACWTELLQFTNGLVEIEPAEDDFDWETYHVYDRLHDTWVMFEKGDWIIKGVQGEFYPCKADIFEQTYEEYKGDEHGMASSA
ncbi:hypothetical protein QEH42_gp272 [Microbacterium phage Pumpernickel]|uniref:Uncharacterized protein n=1 Tax=Microbacterium phage Pumpernickel TaxID=2885983 RepID=A0AAE9C2Y1_9CAUD|nr:hypothetical protein QEH42_gp272 [Microbacterium phage Pumpernickel]UDL15946.1 hypothetical protein SEA_PUMPERNICKEL_196 [Microbacterium phage Pumpernickel]